MSIDLVSALDGVVSSQAQSASRGGPSEFPGVLRSTLEEVESAKESSGSESDSAFESIDRAGSETRDSQTQSLQSEGTPSESQADRKSDLAASADESKLAENEDAASTADTPALRVEIAVLAAQGRNAGFGDAAASVDGRPSEFDAEEARRDLAERGRSFSSQAVGSQRTGAEQVGEPTDAQKPAADGTRDDGVASERSDLRAQLAAEVASNHAGPVAGRQEVASNHAGRVAGRQEVASNHAGRVAGRQEVVSNHPGPVEGAQEVMPNAGGPATAAGQEVVSNHAGLAEGGQGVAIQQRSEFEGEGMQRIDAEERQDGNQPDTGARSGAGGSDRQANEQALFDRAAEGAQSEGVDPNLRQAIENANGLQRAPDTIAVEGVGPFNNPIAGALTEMTPPATPGAPAPPAASDAIAVQTEWLASRGGGTARLLLNPPSLGEIAIRVTLRGGVVDVVMVAQEAIAQSVAEDQSDRLAQAFLSRDLRLESFEVRRGEPEDLANEDLGQFAESGTREEARPDEDQTAGTESSPTRFGRESDRDDAGQAVQPQILSAGPEAGVDLRI